MLSSRAIAIILKMMVAYILACLAVASSIPLKLHSISHLST
ncbi:MAG: hypothetical protein U0T77_10440 [Chitinophagales bacterium]